MGSLSLQIMALVFYYGSRVVHDGYCDFTNFFKAFLVLLFSES